MSTNNPEPYIFVTFILFGDAGEENGFFLFVVNFDKGFDFRIHKKAK